MAGVAERDDRPTTCSQQLARVPVYTQSSDACESALGFAVCKCVCLPDVPSVSNQGGLRPLPYQPHTV
eukprot:1159469-Pelagomonas_calceolata.AAC.4